MKSRLLDQIRAELRANLERLAKAAYEAHAAATDPGSKAESKYDTRNLEASYLAAGQARQVDDLAASLRTFESLTLPDIPPGHPIEAGALVHARLHGQPARFLLVPTAGGMEILHDGQEITLLTPESPLYQKLLGLLPGDTLDTPPLTVTRVI
ncbi:MAG: transcription elongation factor GreAB [Verrucomicrobiota bacterium]